MTRTTPFARYLTAVLRLRELYNGTFPPHLEIKTLSVRTPRGAVAHDVYVTMRDLKEFRIGQVIERLPEHTSEAIQCEFARLRREGYIRHLGGGFGRGGRYILTKAGEQAQEHRRCERTTTK